MTIKVSKDGETFHDIDDSEDSLAAAKAKGYQEYVPVTKDGDKIYNIVATEDSLKSAWKKGYKDPSMFAFQNKKDAETDHGGADAALRGAAQGSSGGFADELSGVAGAIVNPTNSDKGFADRYRDSRDYARGRDKAAEDNHYKTYLGANLAGGVAAGSAVGLGAGVGSAIGAGAAYGLGGSDADLTKGDVGGAAIDTAVGAGLGAAGHGLIKGAGSLLSGEAGQVAGAIKRGAVSGAKEAAADAVPLPGVKAFQTSLGAIKGAYNEVRNQSSTSGEFKSIADMARKVVRGGEDGSVGSYSDDGAVLAALTQDGENPVKQWFAEKAATLNPGQGTAEDYSKLLNMKSADRQAARAFDPREAAAALKPDVEGAQTLFEKARSDRYSELQGAARDAFDNNHVAPVIDHLEGAIADANRLNTTKGVSPLLADVHGIITEGNGIASQGLTRGPAAEAAPQEMFNRLQQARELLDKKIKWANREGESQSEKLLKDVRDNIDGALKTSPDKIEGDALWRKSKDIEDTLFDAMSFGKKGNLDIDEGKIKQLLGGTDKAKRFQAALAQAEDYANTPGLSPEFREQMANLVAGIRQKVGVADDQRAISSFRYKNGPSSPAIERFNSASGKNSLLQDAVRAPAGFLNSADEFNKLVQQRTGQSFTELPQDVKVGAAKFWAWAKKNPDASQALQDATWKKLVILK